MQRTTLLEAGEIKESLASAAGAGRLLVPKGIVGTPLTAESLAVAVTFNPDTDRAGQFKLSGQGVVPGTNTIDVFVDLAEILFTLELREGVPGRAFLATQPIQWTALDQAGQLVPTDVPANMWQGPVVRGEKTDLVSLIDRRLTPSTHSFFLSVLYGDTLFTSPDPTVVNKWPPVK